MSGARMFQVDAFTAEPFRGNPAGVCPLETEPERSWMQAVAAEMNASETAFFWPAQQGGYELRWFTPVVEVALCGHATLASAHVLYEEGRLAPDEAARFHTRSGELRAERLGRNELLGHQVSARGGVLGVRVCGDRVALRGQARTVLRGTLLA